MFIFELTSEQQISTQNNLWSVLHISADMGLADVVELLVQPTYEIELNLKDKV